MPELSTATPRVLPKVPLPEPETGAPGGMDCIQAPVEAGQKVGVVAVKRGGEVVGTTDLVAAKTVPRASLLRRLFLFWR